MMDGKTKKEIKDLHHQKLKTISKNDFIEAAKISNLLGELYTENGLHEDALKEHKDEEHFSKSASDDLGIAVANRKIGECLCELGEFKQALKHQKIHLKISKSTINLVEKQRALATIGRTYFIQAESLKVDGQNQSNVDKYADKALLVYQEALSLSEELYGQISDHDVLEMQARLYLNVGLVYDLKKNLSNATYWLKKSIIISKEESLDDNCYRCYYTMTEWQMCDEEHLQDALHSCKAADTTARKIGKKQLQTDVLNLMAKVLLRLGEFESSLRIFKKLYSNISSRTADVIRGIKQVVKALDLTEKYDDSRLPNEERMKTCEGLGDLYADLNGPKKAIKYYLEQLEIAKTLNVNGKQLADIYSSIGVTHADLREYDLAMQYYNAELNLRSDDLKEKSATYCAAAYALEKIKSSFDTVKEYYMKAIKCAEQSRHHSSLIKAYRDWLEYLSTSGDTHEEKAHAQGTLDMLLKEYGESCDSQEKDDSSDVLNDEELFALHSDSEDEEEERLGDQNAGLRSARVFRNKLNKRNNKGETPLHVAAIAGNQEKVRAILQQGANPNERDNCGWTPLHEACNHGYTGIVQLLIEHSADVNDPGGSHCCGITPLHDAAQNGHLDVVKLLLHAGASLEAKTKQNETPIDYARIAIESNKEEFHRSGRHQSLLQKLNDVESYLQKWKADTQRQIPLKDSRRSDIDILTRLGSSDSDDDLLYGRPPLKRPRITNTNEQRHSRNDSESESSVASRPFTSEESNDNDSNFNVSESSMSPPIVSVKGLHPVSPGKNTPETLLMKRREKLSPVISSKRNTQQNRTTMKQNEISKTNPSHSAKISFSRSRSPRPLLYEDDTAASGVKIIKDIPSAKKKRPKTSRQRQSKLLFEAQSKSPFDELQSMQLKRRHKEPTQRQISNLIEVNATSNALHGTALQSLSTPRSNVYKIKVRVLQTGTMYLVVCKPADQLNIEWLVNETKARHYNDVSISTTSVCLKTLDGALLNPLDTISDVLQDNEEILADFHENQRSIDESEEEALWTDFELALGLDKLLQDLTISNRYLTKSELNILPTSIVRYSNLTSISLSGVFIGDISFSKLMQAIIKQVYLSVLNLSCTGLTCRALASLAQLLSNVESSTDDIRAFSLLSVLSLSHNRFNDVKDFINSMATVLKHCKSLNQLDLQSCCIDSQVFQSNCFTKVLEGSALKCLDVSNNNFSSSNDLMSLMTSLNHTSVMTLNISSLLKQEECDHILTDISDYCVKTNSSLVNLDLTGIDVTLSDERGCPFNTETKFESLLFSTLSLSVRQIESFINSMLQLKYLKELEISCCQSFNSQVFDNICKLTLMKLYRFTARSCTISNIEENCHRYISLPSCSLKYLDLSFNPLILDDIKMLWKYWQARYRTNALRDIGGNKFILFVG